MKLNLSKSKFCPLILNFAGLMPLVPQVVLNSSWSAETALFSESEQVTSGVFSEVTRLLGMTYNDNGYNPAAQCFQVKNGVSPSVEAKKKTGEVITFTTGRTEHGPQSNPNLLDEAIRFHRGIRIENESSTLLDADTQVLSELNHEFWFPEGVNSSLSALDWLNHLDRIPGFAWVGHFHMDLDRKDVQVDRKDLELIPGVEQCGDRVATQVETGRRLSFAITFDLSTIRDTQLVLDGYSAPWDNQANYYFSPGISDTLIQFSRDLHVEAFIARLAIIERRFGVPIQVAYMRLDGSLEGFSQSGSHLNQLRDLLTKSHFGLHSENFVNPNGSRILGMRVEPVSDLGPVVAESHTLKEMNAWVPMVVKYALQHHFLDFSRKLLLEGKKPFFILASSIRVKVSNIGSRSDGSSMWKRFSRAFEACARSQCQGWFEPIEQMDEMVSGKIWDVRETANLTFEMTGIHNPEDPRQRDLNQRFCMQSSPRLCRIVFKATWTNPMTRVSSEVRLVPSLNQGTGMGCIGDGCPGAGLYYWIDGPAYRRDQGLLCASGKCNWWDRRRNDHGFPLLTVGPLPNAGPGASRSTGWGTSVPEICNPGRGFSDYHHGGNKGLCRFETIEDENGNLLRLNLLVKRIDWSTESTRGVHILSDAGYSSDYDLVESYEVYRD